MIKAREIGHARRPEPREWGRDPRTWLLGGIIVVLVVALGWQEALEVRGLDHASTPTAAATATVVPTVATPFPPIVGAASAGRTDASPAGTIALAADERFRGSVLVTVDGVDLDTVPPATGAGFDLAYPGGDGLTVGDDASVWKPATAPAAAQQCATRLAADPLGPSDKYVQHVPAHLGLCLRTSRGRIAFVRVQSVGPGGVDVDAIVWDDPA